MSISPRTPTPPLDYTSSAGSSSSSSSSPAEPDPPLSSRFSPDSPEELTYSQLTDLAPEGQFGLDFRAGGNGGGYMSKGKGRASLSIGAGWSLGLSSNPISQPQQQQQQQQAATYPLPTPNRSQTQPFFQSSARTPLATHTQDPFSLSLNAGTNSGTGAKSVERQTFVQEPLEEPTISSNAQRTSDGPSAVSASNRRRRGSATFRALLESEPHTSQLDHGSPYAQSTAPVPDPRHLLAAPGMNTPGGAGGIANQLEAKVVILGSQGVGKTSIVHRYTSGQFSYSLSSTIGASFLTKKLVIDGCKVRLQIWDTAGQERFRSMAPMYYRGAHAAVLVYDITNPDTFADIQLWLDELRRNMSSDLIVHVVGSKADLAGQRKVPLDHARDKIMEWVSTNDDNDDVAVQPGLTGSVSSLEHSGPSRAPSMRSRNSRAGTSAESVEREARASTSKLSLGLGLGLAGGRGRKADDEGLQSDRGKPWCQVEVSEVSAKDDYGIEDLFLLITGRLVERKAQIERERILRSRDSIILSEDQTANQDGSPPAGSYGCC